MLSIIKFSLLALTLMLSALTMANASDERLRLKLATAEGDSDSPIGKSMQLWADEIKKRSDGRIKINLFYKGQLGSQQEMFDQMLMGNIDMMLSWPQTSYDERLGITNVPYLVLNWEDALKAYAPDGWLVKAIDPVYNEVGIKYFGPYPEGFGGVATRNVQSSTIGGAKGIKIRSQTFFPLPQTINALGYEAVPIDWNEVYTALQTGVADGDGSNVIYWDYQYFGDILTHYTHTRHNFSAGALMMSAKSWEKMDEEDRAIISDAAATVVAKQFADARTEDDKWIATAQENGMTYVDIQGDDLLSLVKKVRATIWPEVEKIMGQDVMAVLRKNASVP